jgi:uncharacterized protein YbjT (DUF2867 family)
VKKRIAIAGATGRVGSLIAAQALNAGHEVSCLVRSQSRAKSTPLATRNARIVIGDISHPAALASLCEAADVVVSTVTSTSSRDPQDSIERVDQDGNLALVEAAEAAGARRFVFVSTPETDPVDEFSSPLELAKRRVEARLSTARLESAVLRSPFIMEVWLSPVTGFDVASSQVRLFGTGEARVHWIGANDVATAALDACTRQEPVAPVITSPGSDHASLAEITTWFEAATGRTFKRDYESLSAIETAFKSATEPKQRSFWSICRKLARGYELPPNPSLPNTQQSLATYVRSVTNSRK